MENLAANTQVHGHPVRAFLVLFFCALILSVSSQPPLSTSSKKALKLYSKAEKAYRERDFATAIELLQDATRIDPGFYEAYLRQGSLYNSLGNEDSVYVNFAKYASLAPFPSASVVERLAFFAFDRGEYTTSQEYLSGFLDQVPEKKDDRSISLLRESIRFSLQQLKDPIEIKIEELPTAINQYALQYLPAMTVDEKTMVYTKRESFRDDEDIVVSYKEEGSWLASQSISSRINTTANEGAATISADGRTMIFTACDRKDSYGSCDLYVSYKVGDSWSRPKNLGRRVNTKYWESQPSLSADGQILYFTSNRPGGYGGRDIWIARRDGKDWGFPKNLGRQVNSFKDETTPFIHFNGQTLYLSSNSYPGLGGFDLFSSQKNDSLWSAPANLGYPINTFRDEVALLVSPNGESGYFAKELQKNREILDSKIVKFELPDSLEPEASYYLSGKVLDKDTRIPLKADLQVVDVSTNEVLYKNYSDSISGEFYLVLPAKGEFAGYVKRKGYLYEDFRFNTALAQDFNIDTIEIELTKVTVGESLILKNIYFGTDSYELDERSRSEIENVCELLRQNPTMVIEIGGHTDNVGNETYNQDLSEKRAFSVRQAIIDEGISSQRLKHLGYGDSQPISSNANEDGRQSNRRIEFRVLRTKR